MVTLPCACSVLARALSRVFVLSVCAIAALAPVAAEFVHPGLLHSQQDLDRLKAAVAAQTSPIYQGYLAFAAHSGSQPGYTMQGPFAGFGRDSGQHTNEMHNDANAAYQLAIMCAVTGDTGYAQKAIQIINGWSSTMTAVLGVEPVLSCMDGYKLANAAEILRHTNSGWAATDIARCERWFKEVWYPTIENFAYYANGNWDNSAIKTMMAFGVFCDDRAMFERAVRFYLDGAGNGKLTHYVVNEDGQSQESGRDQQHTMLGLGLLAEAAQIGWNQGIDLFSVANNRLLKGFEYTASYNLGNTVPYTPYRDRSGKYGAGGYVSNYSVISTIGRGEYRPVYEMIWNHYLYRVGLDATAVEYSKQFADANRPEGGAQSADHPGFGTFLFAFTGPVVRPAPTTAPLTPAGLFAYGSSAGNVLSWAPSLDTTSYTVKRATTRGGPYTTIASDLAAPTYTDADVAAGQVYCYVVSASNAVGESANALEVSIAAGLPEPWATADIGSVVVTGRADFDGQRFKLEGAGADIGGTVDEFRFAYLPMSGDGTIVARVILPLSSQRSKVGLMMRETLAPDSAHAAVLLPVTSTATWMTRDMTGASAVVTGTATIPSPYTTRDHLDFPYWVKLTRAGDTFTGWISPDGTTWTQVGSSALAMAADLYVGLPACSRLTTVTTTATFDNVIAPGFSVSAPSAPQNLESSFAGTQIALQWTQVDGAVSYTVKRATAAGGPYTAIATDLTRPSFLVTDQTGSAASYYVVTATNIAGESINSSELPVAIPAPVITSATSLSSFLGSPFSYTITADNSPAAFGATGLPEGLSLNTATGLISGTPTASGGYAVALTASNVAGTGSATLMLTISPPPAPVISSTTTADATQGDIFRYAITASNSPNSYGASGLPAGLSLDSNTGEISGTPLTTGTFSVALTATNVGGTGTATLMLTVAPAAPSANGAWTATAVTTTAVASTSGSPTLTWTGQTFAVGDVVRLTSPVPGGFSTNTPYVVVSGGAGTFQLAASATGTAINATSTITTGGAQRYLGWPAAVHWSGGVVAGGFGATATFTTSIPSGVTLDGTVRLGSLSYASGSISDLVLVSGKNNGALLFTTPSGVPAINLGTAGNRKMFLGNFANNITAPLTLAGTQGLQITTAAYASTSGYASVRLMPGVDWSGFSGGITLNQGVLEVRNATGSSSGANTLLPAQRLALGTGSAAATLLFSGRFSTQTIGALDGNASGRILATSVGGALMIGADNENGVYAGSFCVSPFTPNTVDTGRIDIVKTGFGTQVLSGVVGNGVTSAVNTSITVHGGKLVLSAANTYLGATTVNGGVLLVNGSIVSAATVNAGVLGGTGSSSATVTIGTGSGEGATLAPGHEGIGTFTTTSALTLRGDALLALEFSPSTGTADKIVANGVTLTNATFSPTIIGIGGAMSGGTVFTLVDNTSAAPVSGTFNGVPEGGTVTVGTNACAISYVGGTGNDITLTVLGDAAPPIISSTTASGAFGAAFNFAIAASNSPTSFSATGLPAGLTINAATGVISGTPRAGGTFIVTVTASNVAGSTTADVTLRIAPVVGVNLRAYNTYGMPVTDAAGVVRASYWNNLVGPTVAGETVTTSSLTDNLGVPLTGMSVSFTAGSTGGSYTGSGTVKRGNDAVTVGPALNDVNLYSSVFDQFDGTPGMFAVTGIPYASYDVIVYVHDDGPTRGGTITANGETLAIRGGAGNPDVSGSGYVASTDDVNTSGPSVQQGNYVRFTNLSGDLTAIVVATNVGSATQRLKIAGFQIIGNDSIPAPTAVPEAPGGVSASGGNAQVALNWSHTATALSYHIYKGGSLLATVASPLTSYADTAVANDTSYSYTVSAVNAVGEGPRSPLVSATPAAPAFALPQRTVYQYSIPMTPIFGSWTADPQRRAYLWVPPGTTKLQGVLLGLHNMLEKPMFDDPAIRQACADANLGIVFITPGDSKTWTSNGVGNYTAGALTTAIDLDPSNYKSADINPATGTNYPTDLNPATGARFTNQTEQAGAEVAALLANLAVESGYAELQYAPLLLAGHSAASPFTWIRGLHATAALNGRIFALLPYKGSFPGNIPGGMPIFHTASEWQEISNWGNTWELGDAPALRALRSGGADRLLSAFVQPGTGHYQYSESQSGPIALFIRKAAEYRIPANWPATSIPTLTTIAPASGYLVDVTKLGSGNCQPVSHADWVAAGKDPLRAYWYFDAETAQAVCDVQNAGFAKRPQVINGYQNATTLAPLAAQNNGAGTVSLTAALQSDGVTFKVRAANMNQTPVPRLFHGGAVGIASGSILFKANGSGALKQTGADTFRVWMDRGSVVKEGQPWEPFVIARHPGDADYREADRPIWVTTSAPVNNINGTAQTITFPDVPNQRADQLAPLTLNATASSGLPVQYWVVSGPYRNDENDSAALIPDQLPAKPTYPIRVIVGAWQWGQPNAIAAAPIVFEEFFIQAPPPPVITSAATSGGTYGAAFSYAIAATESPTSYSVTGLPAGLELDTDSGVISGVPSESGEFTVNLGASNLGGTGTATLVLSIAKAPATVTIDSLTHVFDGSAKSVSISTDPAALAVDVSYNGAAVAPVNAGSYTVVAMINDPNYAGSASAMLVITKVPATVTLGDLSHVYDGSGKPASATTAPAELNVDFTYDAAAAVPVAAGSYAVVGTITDPNYEGSASGLLTIARAPAVVVLGSLAHTYDGTAKFAEVVTSPTGLAVSLTYNNNATPPIGAGNYAVSASVVEQNYTGSATGTLVIAKAEATITLAPLVQAYDGTLRSVTATTEPEGVTVNITYDEAAATAPIYPGAHTVTATIDDPNYEGSVIETLDVTITALVRHAPTLDGITAGSMQVLQPEDVVLNGTSSVAGDLLVPGSPSLRLNGEPTYVGVRNGPGSPTPSSHVIGLNGGAVLRYLVRQVDAIELPTVVAPPAPAGTRNVTLNSSGQSPGKFATLRNLTLNGGAGLVAIPPGTYGAFTANGSSGFVLGVAGAIEPAVYNLQALTLNGTSTLRVVGPVRLALANGTIISGSAGDAAQPDWLTVHVHNGGATLNRGASLHGVVIAPSGTVSLGDGAAIHGRIVSDRLLLGLNALLDEVP